jgi:hypothetical protein
MDIAAAVHYRIEPEVINLRAAMCYAARGHIRNFVYIYIYTYIHIYIYKHTQDTA